MTIRRLTACAVLLLAAGSASASDLTLVRVFTGWRDAASFKRISEYFDGKENTHGEAVLRTNPAERAGYYFLVRVKNSAAPRTVKASLQVITALEARPVTHEFDVPLAAGDTVFHLGLTGDAWAAHNARPVAWKLTLLDAAGQALAAETSYLWELPGTK